MPFVEMERGWTVHTVGLGWRQEKVCKDKNYLGNNMILFLFTVDWMTVLFQGTKLPFPNSIFQFSSLSYNLTLNFWHMTLDSSLTSIIIHVSIVHNKKIIIHVWIAPIDFLGILVFLFGARQMQICFFFFLKKNKCKFVMQQCFSLKPNFM